MLIIKDIYDYIDSFAPFSSQCEWDNSGLLIGDFEKSVSKIGISLDATEEVIENAISENCDLIITHHPIIFKPISSVSSNDLVYKLINNNISIICAHTNLDKSTLGVNPALAEKLKLKNTQFCNKNSDADMCIVGETNIIDANEFIKSVSKALNTTVSYSINKEIINNVAVCGGAGGEFISEFNDNEIDAFITGEIKYHEFLDSSRKNITLISAGHFETEYPVVTKLQGLIKSKFDIDCIELLQTKQINYFGE